MRASRLAGHVSLIDVEPVGIKNFIASYVLQGKKATILETGPTSCVPNLLAGLKELNVDRGNIAYVAVSHIHLDHGGGVGALIKHLPNAEVIVHRRGAPHLANPEKLWQQSKAVLQKIADWYGQPEPVPPQRIVDVTDGMSFDLGNDVTFKVQETMGHASHHQSYFEPASRAVFPGDAAGVYVKQFDLIVPTIPTPFRPEEALSSIEKLKALQPRTLYYTHFGGVSNAVEKLQSYADQIRLWMKIARETLENKEGLQRLRERILEEDSNVRKAAEYIKAHPILSDTVLLNSVEGAFEAAQKYGRASE